GIWATSAATWRHQERVAEEEEEAEVVEDTSVRSTHTAEVTAAEEVVEVALAVAAVAVIALAVAMTLAVAVAVVVAGVLTMGRRCAPMCLAIWVLAEMLQELHNSKFAASVQSH
uniref:Uncharacterized protein n=1 Tax=Parascaris univalens TaxID=6257 RepID=A0A914ZJ62_PARUN